jgi:hypothetical protein
LRLKYIGATIFTAISEFFFFFSALKVARIMVIIITFTSYFQGLRRRGTFRSKYNPEIPSNGVVFSFFLSFAFHSIVRQSGRVHATNVSYPFIVMVVDVPKNCLRFKFFQDVFLLAVVKCYIFCCFPQKKLQPCYCDSKFVSFFSDQFSLTPSRLHVDYSNKAKL